MLKLREQLNLNIWLFKCWIYQPIYQTISSNIGGKIFGIYILADPPIRQFLIQFCGINLYLKKIRCFSLTGTQETYDVSIRKYAYNLRHEHWIKNFYSVVDVSEIDLNRL